MVEILTVLLMGILPRPDLDLDKLTREVNISRGLSISILPSEEDFRMIEYWCQAKSLKVDVFPNTTRLWTVNIDLARGHEITKDDLETLIRFVSLRSISYRFPGGTL